MKFKLILDQRYTRADNRHPLKLRVYEGDSYKERSLRMFLLDEEWDSENQVYMSAAPVQLFTPSWRPAHKNYGLIIGYAVGSFATHRATHSSNQHALARQEKLIHPIISQPTHRAMGDIMWFIRYTCPCLRCHQWYSLSSTRGTGMILADGY